MHVAELRPFLKKRKIIPVTVDRGDSFYDPERDGVTFSLLNSWLSCREAARLNLTGVTARFGGFATTFGSIVHALLQEAYVGVRNKKFTGPPSRKWVLAALDKLQREWIAENPMPDDTAAQHLELTLLLCESLMPLYFEHWANDFAKRWEKIEAEFKVPLEVRHSNGRTYRTFLRGKMDGSFVTDKAGVRSRLLETKTKSRLEEGNLADILPFELQVNIYLYALLQLEKRHPVGVLYNVIRRPGLRQRKRETLPQFAQRITTDIRRRPDWYFIRMNMQIQPHEIDRFEGELLDLVAEFCAWWRGDTGHYRTSSNCENKYGTCWALPICSRREYSHTFKRDKVFRELVEVM